jgi:hypothetical protein
MVMGFEDDIECRFWQRIAPGKWQEATDPRNAEDYDTWSVGMEPIPGDTTWAKTKQQA